MAAEAPAKKKKEAIAKKRRVSKEAAERKRLAAEAAAVKRRVTKEVANRNWLAEKVAVGKREEASTAKRCVPEEAAENNIICLGLRGVAKTAYTCRPR